MYVLGVAWHEAIFFALPKSDYRDEVFQLQRSQITAQSNTPCKDLYIRWQSGSLPASYYRLCSRSFTGVCYEESLSLRRASPSRLLTQHTGEYRGQYRSLSHVSSGCVYVYKFPNTRDKARPIQEARLVNKDCSRKLE